MGKIIDQCEIDHLRKELNIVIEANRTLYIQMKDLEDLVKKLREENDHDSV